MAIKTNSLSKLQKVNKKPYWTLSLIWPNKASYVSRLECWAFKEQNRK